MPYKCIFLQLSGIFSAINMCNYSINGHSLERLLWGYWTFWATRYLSYVNVRGYWTFLRSVHKSLLFRLILEILCEIKKVFETLDLYPEKVEIFVVPWAFFSFLNSTFFSLLVQLFSRKWWVINDAGGPLEAFTKYLPKSSQKWAKHLKSEQGKTSKHSSKQNMLNSLQNNHNINWANF